MTLDQFLDVERSYLLLEAREKNWSAVDICCTCKTCYQYCVCADTVLIGMCFDPTLSVPDKWEQAEPSLRKARGRRAVGLGRGVAGEKRRLELVKTMEKSKKDGVKKSTRMRIQGPLASAPITPAVRPLRRPYPAARVHLCSADGGVRRRKRRWPPARRAPSRRRAPSPQPPPSPYLPSPSPPPSPCTPPPWCVRPSPPSAGARSTPQR